LVDLPGSVGNSLMFDPAWLSGLGIALALGSSLLLALGGWFQWRGLRSLGQNLSIQELVRVPLWLGGLFASAGGTVAYHGALLLAPLTVVQPLSSLHVAFTAMLAWRGRRVRYREGLALVFCLAGTACLALADISSASEHVQWIALTILVICGALPLALPSPAALERFWPSLRAGLCYGLSAILWKAGMALPALSPAWFVLLALFTAGFLGGFVFLQLAFRKLDAGTANALAACVAALFPLPAGLWVFHESPSLLSLFAALTAIAGVFLLGTATPVLTAAPDNPPTP
jgi:drug/metabolite transporter (DMT)-like permease